MTDKLHCPFCGMELKTDVNLLGYSTKYWYCENTSCAHLKDSMREDVWQALIDGKAAQNVLKVASKTIDAAERFCSGIIARDTEIQKAVHHAHFLYRIPHFAALLYTNIQDSKDKIASITTQEKE